MTPRVRSSLLLIPLALLFGLGARFASSSLLPHLRHQKPQLAQLDPAGFQISALNVANWARAKGSTPAPALTSDPSAISVLEGFVASGIESQDALDHLFATLQEQRPQLHEIGSHCLSGSSQQDLLAALASWPELKKPSYTHLATALFRQPSHTQIHCLVTVLGELPPLDLPAPRRVPLSAFDTCRVCQSGQALTLLPQSQSTLFIRCPQCRNPYNLLAADSSGNWRRANQFLEGIDSFRIEGDLEPRDVVLRIWEQVDERCRYQFDPQRVGGEDSWNLPSQTYALKWGDCEDTSMLLTDALISNGIDARVALGTHQGQGHAWCVVRLGDHQYILESTTQGVEHLRNLPRLDDVALDYQPECLFDRDNLYFNRYHQWTANYWSETTWLRVSYPQETVSAVASIEP